MKVEIANRETIGDRMRTHGMRKSITYVSWSSMRTRCNNPNFPCYSAYGGSGITVCDRWNSFENFIAAMGERPSLGFSIHAYPVDTHRYFLYKFRHWATPPD